MPRTGSIGACRGLVVVLSVLGANHSPLTRSLVARSLVVRRSYKMPRLVAKVEGRGNGIKTNVVNCTDIAKALERPPEYVIKFMGIELGAQTKFDKKSGTSIVNGTSCCSVG